MAENTKIEWCDHTVNLWHGCAKVHTGCKNCYAETQAKRWGFDIWGENKYRKEIKSAFKDLEKYEKQAKETGKKAVVFIGSMMDIFEVSKPLVNTKGEKMVYTTASPFIKLFTEITGGKYDNLIFLFLTKRPQNIGKMLERYREIPKNVWFGTSISDQQTANELIPALLERSPRGSNLFLSIEPQIDFINLNQKLKTFNGVEYEYNLLTGKKSFDISGGRKHIIQKNTINWVIQGGESGIRKREFRTEWAYFLKTQCKNAGVPYFFKQIDKVRPIPPDLLIREKPF